MRHSQHPPLLRFTVPKDFRPERLDKWLSHRIPDVSRSEVQRWIRDGRVTAGKRILTRAFRLEPGMTLEARPGEADVNPVPAPADLPLELLYGDEHLIAVNKPPGLVAHPAPGHPGNTLLNALLHHFPDIADVGDPERPGLVHRLDADTSGVLVVARTPVALEHLQRQFKSRQTGKTYLAICHGIPSAVEETIDLPLGRHPTHRKKRAVNGDAARPAVTHYRLERGLARGNASLLEITIETGRTHQIRVHMAHRLHPVLGDSVYGGKRARLPTPWPKAERQMLHAFRLRLLHPFDNRPMEFEAPPPPDFEDFLRRLTP